MTAIFFTISGNVADQTLNQHSHWMFKMLSTRLWRKQTNQISQYFWPNVSEGLTNSEHHFRVQLTFTPKHMYVIACYYYLIFNGFIIITSSRKHQIVCHTYLSMNCLCEREALSNTSMLQGPSSCNLKSEFNDLNKQTWRGEQNITTSQSGLCTKQCVQITTGSLCNTSLNFSLLCFWIQVSSI